MKKINRIAIKLKKFRKTIFFYKTVRIEILNSHLCVNKIIYNYNLYWQDIC